MLETPLHRRGETTARIAGESTSHGRLILTVFHLDGNGFAVEASAVREITFMAQLSTPVGLPPMIAGFLNLAQCPIPVIRLRRLLGLPESTPGLYSQILILRDGDAPPVGWIVDGVTQIIPLRREEILPVPANHCFRDCATGIWTANGNSISILAPSRVLLEQERRCMMDFQAREQERLQELERSRP
jgi:purine-binding chemotaxis protein CheW